LTAWLAAPAALHVMEQIGMDKWQHGNILLQQAVALLLRAFQTGLSVGEQPAGPIGQDAPCVNFHLPTMNCNHIMLYQMKVQLYATDLHVDTHLDAGETV
jgi:hypothetical protein